MAIRDTATLGRAARHGNTRPRGAFANNEQAGAHQFHDGRATRRWEALINSSDSLSDLGT
jgi:hypothetical protein